MSPIASSCASLGLTMPKMFLGTLGITGPELVGKTIHSAIKSGYRHFDCAPVYFNEEYIGDAIANEISNGTIKRDELFITSKLASPFHRREHVEMALRKTLLDLRLDYLDLYLIHWPVAFHFVPFEPTQRGWTDESIDDSDGGRNIDPNVTVRETWRAMEDLVDKGLVRHIGVCNFPVALMHELMADYRIKPYANQVELHPYLQQRRLVDYCRARGVQVQGYSSLGTPGYKEEAEPSVLEDEVLRDLAEGKNVSVAQLVLAWGVQRGYSVIAKSVTPARQKENIEAIGLRLTDDEMKIIAGLDRGYRYFRPEDWWGSMKLAVFD